jgi:hypothetical protein
MGKPDGWTDKDYESYSTLVREAVAMEAEIETIRQAREFKLEMAQRIVFKYKERGRLEGLMRNE